MSTPKRAWSKLRVSPDNEARLDRLRTQIGRQSPALTRPAPRNDLLNEALALGLAELEAKVAA